MRIILTKEKHLGQAGKMLSEAYFNTLKEARNHLKKKIKSKLSYVAVDKNEVLGLIGYKRDYSHYANYLSDIVVAKQHRRKGIALKLFEKYIEISKKQQPKKQKYALSSTDVTNKVSIRLHKKFGFRELGRIKHLHFGKDEIIFGYKLF